MNHRIPCQTEQHATLYPSLQSAERRACRPVARLACGLVLAALVAIEVGAAGAPQQPVPATGGEAALVEARRLFDALDYEHAVAVLDMVIVQLQSRIAQEPSVKATLVSAYEMRARARFGLGNQDGARADFKLLLALAPGHALPDQVSPRVVAVFDEVKNATVGRVHLTITPADAELELDGTPLAVAAGAIPLATGSHTLVAKKPGYRRGTQEFLVAANATVEVPLGLERVSATISIVTVPAAVEVLVDGVSRGTTTAGPLAPEYADWPARLSVPSSSISRPMILDDVPTGSHLVEFRRDCHVRAERRVDVKEPADYRLDPVKLDPAVARVRVDSKLEGAVVFLDDKPRGAVPLLMEDVCEGPHTVEIRTPQGRFVRRIDAHTGDQVSLEGAIKPAFAILSTSGLPEGLRGGPDLRLAVEKALDVARAATFFAPAGDKVAQALQAERLSPGWLAFDRERRSIGEVAPKFTSSARRDISARLARALDVQGLAEVTVPPGGDPNQILVTLLAAGSGEPDVLELRLDKPESLARALSQLERMPPLLRPSVGLHAVDVLDVAGAVVVSNEPNSAAARAGLAPGDVIVRANGKPVGDAVQLAALLGELNANDHLTAEARDRTGVAKRADLTVTTVPRAVWMGDQTLVFNKLILELRFRLASSAGPVDESVGRLNLGVSLMRVGNWSDALAELDRVRLPDGPGVSNGTVQYLTGLCYEALGRLPEAEKAWRAAAAVPESMLTEDGPLVKDLADRKLKDLQRRGGPSFERD